MSLITAVLVTHLPILASWRAVMPWRSAVALILNHEMSAQIPNSAWNVWMNAYHSSTITCISTRCKPKWLSATSSTVTLLYGLQKIYTWNECSGMGPFGCRYCQNQLLFVHVVLPARCRAGTSTELLWLLRSYRAWGILKTATSIFLMAMLK